MGRREWPLRFVCGHDGCIESVTFRYETRRDLINSYEQKWYSGGRWRCIRHANANELMTKDNLQTTFEVTSAKHEHGVFFGSHGLVSGPGFKVFASDFPPGTKLVVNARIELPEVE